MTNYIVRVELHRATEEDYERLHDAMERQGFVRWVISDDSAPYRLPTAQYHMANTNIGMRDAWGRANAAAMLWSGLEAWL